MEADHSRRGRLSELEVRAEIAAARLEHDTQHAVAVLRDHLWVLLAFERTALAVPRRTSRPLRTPRTGPTTHRGQALS